MAAARRRVVQAEDLSNVEFETSEDVEVIPTFDAIGLREDLLRGIYAYGFEKPSAIQQRSIKPVIKGRDVIAQYVQSYLLTVSCLLVITAVRYRQH